MHNECICDQYACKLFLKHVQTHFVPQPNHGMHMSILMSVQVKKPSMVTKLHIKLYISNTPTILHMKNKSWQNLNRVMPTARTTSRIAHPVNLYIAGTQACSPTSNPAVLYPRKARNRIV